MAELASQIAANSSGSLAAYKDLYEASDQLGLQEGLAYEYGHDYPISDTAERLSEF